MRVGLTRSQAGLFSAVTSAFIIDVQSQLQPDTGEETAALLRVLIYKIDNTTFGDDPPTLPQWTGPPHTIIQVQAILYASLAASLLSAFLAMLGKQWLNRYASTDLRGTAIERSQDRQRKLDGIITWYFDHVLESLPLMLQAALLLLGCALSRYLWQINVTVASVVLGVTSSGLAFYVFIFVAGVAFESCPYQTPGSHALRHIWPEARRVLHSAFIEASRKSKALNTIAWNVEYHHPWWSRGKIKHFLKDIALEIPRALAIDIYHLGRATVRLSSIPVVSLARRGHVRSHGVPPTLGQELDQQTDVLDLRCISWMLQTSLDKTVHLSALKHLATMMTLTNFDPTLVADCFNAFISCIKVSLNNHEVVITQELEQLAAVAALCFFNTISHLLVMDPTSSVLEDIRQRYIKVFSAQAYSRGHQSYHTVNAACCLFIRRRERQFFQWSDHQPSAYEHTIIAHNLVKLARFRYQRTPQAKVPRFILRFALYSLSLSPPPSTSVVANCLSIIAIDLGCDVADVGTTTLDERCAFIRWTVIALSPELACECGESRP